MSSLKAIFDICFNELNDEEIIAFIEPIFLNHGIQLVDDHEQNKITFFQYINKICTTPEPKPEPKPKPKPKPETEPESTKVSNTSARKVFVQCSFVHKDGPRKGNQCPMPCCENSNVCIKHITKKNN